jgi:hypothetical protein
MAGSFRRAAGPSNEMRGTRLLESNCTRFNQMRPARPIRRPQRLARIVLVLVAGFGADVRAAEQPPVGKMIEMEPFFVSGSGVPWRHARIPGYEILSHYSDATTMEFLEGLDAAGELLEFVVPEQFQAKFDVPHVIILCGQDMMSPTSKDILDASATRGIGIPRGADGPGIVPVFPNVEAVAEDRIESLVTNEGAALGTRIVLIDPAHVSYLLERRSPPLPPWLLSGLLDIYGGLYGANKTTSITNADAVEQRRRRDEGNRTIALTESDLVSHGRFSGSDTHQEHTDFVYRIPPFIWISANATKTEKGFYGSDGRGGQRLMGDLFTREPPQGGPEWEAWRARAGLFVRWSFDKEYQPYSNVIEKTLDIATAGPVNERYVVDGTNSPRRDAFFRFSARACAEPVTEAIFTECYGLTYSQAAARLNEYLAVAIKNPIDIRIRGSGATLAPGLRDATRTEVARIKGDWERLAVADVQAQFHDSTSNFIREALRQAYERGDRDPQLLAVMGLLESDMGNDAGAVPYLEAAAGANVAGPRVYFDLARIRYDQLRPGDGERFSDAEVDRIISPLEAGRFQAPPLREYYDLAAKVLANSDGPLTAGRLAFMSGGLRLFPRDLELLYLTASVEATHGHPAEAAALAATGVDLSLRLEDRIRFSMLRDRASQGMAVPSPGPGGK